jgi:hypothetical protein
MEARLEAAAPARERMNTSEAEPSEPGGMGGLATGMADTLTSYESGVGVDHAFHNGIRTPPPGFSDLPTPCEAAAMQRMNRKRPRLHLQKRCHTDQQIEN